MEYGKRIRSAAQSPGFSVQALNSTVAECSFTFILLYIHFVIYSFLIYSFCYIFILLYIHFLYIHFVIYSFCYIFISYTFILLSIHFVIYSFYKRWVTISGCTWDFRKSFLLFWSKRHICYLSRNVYFPVTFSLLNQGAKVRKR